jgi:DUF1680 family protein
MTRILNANNWINTIIIAFVSTSVLAGNTQKNERSVLDKDLSVFALNEVKLKDSWISKREDLNRSYLYRLDAERLLHNFRVNAGIKSDAKPLDGWENPGIGLRGHFTGHYLSACASEIAQTGDTLLKRRIDYMVLALAECQQKLGGKYLSAFPEKDFDALEKGQWVWAPYYTYHKVMQGLLDVYTLTGNKKAYELVLNMADFVEGRLANLSSEQIEKMLYTPNSNPGNEAGAMNEVLHNLYSVSKNEKHLKLAKIFDREWFSKPLANGVDILSGLHSNTHLVLVNGFAKRYENTHEKLYRDAAVNFWEILLHHHCYVNGSSSGPRPNPTTPTAMKAEHWGKADGLSATLSDEIAESCVSHNTQKLSATLFRWTANPQYADAYMNTFYNSVLALQNKEDGAVTYHLPLSSPRTKKFLKENDFRCCNGTGIEAFTQLNANVYFHNNASIWVNLFVPSEVNWKEQGVILEQTNNFPEDQKTTISVRANSPTHFALNLFIPSWANSKTRILVNGITIQIPIKPLSYVKIDRQWKTGDKVELQFVFDYRIQSMSDNKNVIALSYGPVLLAFETGSELILKGSQKEILSGITKSSNELSFSLKNGDTTYKLMPFYQITGQSFGVYATIRNEY